MDDSSGYTPPKIWSWNKESGGRFASTTRPIAGPTHEKELPVGRHPLQLYSLATPNGVKVTVMLEELLELGDSGAEYDAWLIRSKADPRFRIRRDPALSRRKVRRLPADQRRRARGMPLLVVLADGQRAVSR